MSLQNTLDSLVVAGLFDVDDNRTLDETEFAGFVTTFIYGLGAAFGLRHKDDIMPSMKSIRRLSLDMAHHMSSELSSCYLLEVSRLHIADGTHMHVYTVFGTWHCTCFTALHLFHVLFFGSRKR